MEVKISKEKPPVYERCREQFGIDWERGIAFAYGETIHSKNPVVGDLLAHEKAHCERQIVIGVEKWWDLYLADPQFRLDEEVIAYRVQVGWINNHPEFYKKHQKRRRIESLAKSLSGPVYGNLIPYQQAFKIIQS